MILEYLTRAKSFNLIYSIKNIVIIIKFFKNLQYKYDH